MNTKAQAAETPRPYRREREFVLRADKLAESGVQVRQDSQGNVCLLFQCTELPTKEIVNSLVDVNYTDAEIEMVLGQLYETVDTLSLSKIIRKVQ